MNDKTVLVVEDEETLLEALRYNLSKEGYRVAAATDGEQALEMAEREHPDLVLLDLMLPKLDGLEVTRILRKRSNVPILMLTARAEEVDRVVGLELGADDYVTKPFSMRELLARVRAVFRRQEMLQAASAAGQPRQFTTGELSIDLDTHQATLAGHPLSLKPREYDLLAFLVQNKGHAFTRDQLLQHVWGYDYSGDTRTVDVHVRWLREKIESNPAEPIRLLTIRGVGYRFVE
ncbi:MAG: response regulator transcription factor [Chloroflexota bacterium]|nr:response regulator transcription factor [Chloroflexota bacterium]